MATQKIIKERDYTLSLTQYLESQKDQDMTRLLNFLELKRGKERGFLSLGMEERGGYTVVVEEI